MDATFGLGGSTTRNPHIERVFQHLATVSQIDNSTSPLHADEQTVDRLLQADYWRELCPDLHVDGQRWAGKAGIRWSSDQLNLADDAFIQQCQDEIRDAGYFQLPPSIMTQLVGPAWMARLAAAVVQLMHHGWHPWFLAVYDEPWIFAHQLSKIVHQIVGRENVFNMDFLAWLIDPKVGASGFSPHRDRQPECPSETFRDDGIPMYLTCWIPLTDAVPDNGCLYLIPK